MQKRKKLMESYISAMKTCIISGPKRSGTTLLNRMFDSHPELMVFHQEGYFWEHVYNYDIKNQMNLLLDIFTCPDRNEIFESILDRRLLPCANGVYDQRYTAVEISKELKFNLKKFKRGLEQLKGCKRIQDIWSAFVETYSKSYNYDLMTIKASLIKCADYGKTILAAQKYLPNVKSIFIIRNPFYAIESLKVSRQMRKEKSLHPINFAEVISDYLFFWCNRSDIFKPGTLLVYYEELVTNPRNVTKRMADHLEISFKDILLVPTLAKESWAGLSSFMVTSGIDPRVLDRKLEQLNEFEIEIIKKHLFPLLQKYRYDISSQLPDYL